MKQRLRFSPWQIVLAACLVYLAVILFVNSGDWKAFVTIGNCYSTCQGFRGCAEGTTNGYDGQFAYYIARDPANAAGCLDVPAYRYQRILLPLTGRLLALGNMDLIPIAFLVINTVALVGGTLLLEQLLSPYISRWYALVYGLFIGVFMSVRLSTTEPLAYGLVIAAIWLSMRIERVGITGWQAGLPCILWLLAALAKETTLVFVGGYLLFEVLNRQWSRALRLALIVGIPYALWQLFLYLWLGSFGAGSGGAGNSPFEVIPFNGFWHVLTDSTGSTQAFLILGSYTFPAIILPSLWGFWVTLRGLHRGERDLTTLLLLVNCMLMAVVPFSTYREPLGIFRFMPGLILSYLLYTAQHHPTGRALHYSPLWLALLAYLVAA